MSLVTTLKFITSHPLNSRNRAEAVMRFARWQIASRLIDGDVVFSWVNGTRFKVRRGQTGLTGNIYTGLHEFEDMAFLLHYLRPEDIFVDVGANVGSYTILASAAVGASCIAFEPVPITFSQLVENVRLNGRESTVRCFNVAVGSDAGQIRFTTNADTVNHVIAEGELSDAAVEVPIVKIDSILAGEIPRLIKIDVEGYEKPAIEGAKRSMEGREPQAIIMELNGSGARYGFDESRLMEHMLDSGFKPHDYDPLSRTLKERSAKSGNSGNTLFIRDLEFARGRVGTAPKYNVLGRDL